MEKLVDSEHGPTVLIACLVALLALHLLWKIGEKTLESHSDKAEKLEEKIDRLSGMLSSFMADTIRITDKMTDMEGRLSELIGVETKIRRLNRAVKTLAGDEWEEMKRHLDDE